MDIIRYKSQERLSRRTIERLFIEIERHGDIWYQDLYDILWDKDKQRARIDIDIGDTKTNRSLILAVCELNCVRLAQILLSIGCNGNIKDTYGTTPLLASIFRKNIKIAELLIQEPNINILLEGYFDGTCHTPITAACCIQNISLIQSILHRAPTAACQVLSSLETPLHCILRKNCIDDTILSICKLLQAYGCNPYSISYDGNSPLDLAIYNQHWDVVELLVSIGISYSYLSKSLRNKQYNQSIYYYNTSIAFQKGYIKFCKYINISEIYQDITVKPPPYILSQLCLYSEIILGKISNSVTYDEKCIHDIHTMLNEIGVPLKYFDTILSDSKKRFYKLTNLIDTQNTLSIETISEKNISLIPINYKNIFENIFNYEPKLYDDFTNSTSDINLSSINTYTNTPTDTTTDDDNKSIPTSIYDIKLITLGIKLNELQNISKLFNYIDIYMIVYDTISKEEKKLQIEPQYISDTIISLSNSMTWDTVKQVLFEIFNTTVDNDNNTIINNKNDNIRQKLVHIIQNSPCIEYNNYNFTRININSNELFEIYKLQDISQILEREQFTDIQKFPYTSSFYSYFGIFWGRIILWIIIWLSYDCNMKVKSLPLFLFKTLSCPGLYWLQSISCKTNTNYYNTTIDSLFIIYLNINIFNDTTVEISIHFNNKDNITNLSTNYNNYALIQNDSVYNSNDITKTSPIRSSINSNNQYINSPKKSNIQQVNIPNNDLIPQQSNTSQIASTTLSNTVLTTLTPWLSRASALISQMGVSTTNSPIHNRTVRRHHTRFRHRSRRQNRQQFLK